MIESLFLFPLAPDLTNIFCTSSLSEKKYWHNGTMLKQQSSKEVKISLITNYFPLAQGDYHLLHLKAPQTIRCRDAPEPSTCLLTSSFKSSTTSQADALVADPQDNMFSKKIFWLASALLLIGVQAQSHQMDVHAQVAAPKTELSHKYPAVNALL